MDTTGNDQLTDCKVQQSTQVHGQCDPSSIYCLGRYKGFGGHISKELANSN